MFCFKTYELDSRLLRACASFRHGRLPGDDYLGALDLLMGLLGIAAVRVKRQLGSAPARAKEQQTRGAGEAAQVHDIGQIRDQQGLNSSNAKFGRKSFLPGCIVHHSCRSASNRCLSLPSIITRQLMLWQAVHQRGQEWRTGYPNWQAAGDLPLV